jgi:hypothetical protein
VICDFGDFDFGFLTAIAIAIAIPQSQHKNAGEPAITREIRQASQRPFWWFGVV